jgi:hypothetical protein
MDVSLVFESRLLIFMPFVLGRVPNCYLEGRYGVSYLFTRTFTRSAWYLDNGASLNMRESWERFNSLTEKDSRIHVELSDDSKYAVKGEGTILF